MQQWYGMMVYITRSWDLCVLSVLILSDSK